MKFYSAPIFKPQITAQFKKWPFRGTVAWVVIIVHFYYLLVNTTWLFDCCYTYFYSLLRNIFCRFFNLHLSVVSAAWLFWVQEAVFNGTQNMKTIMSIFITSRSTAILLMISVFSSGNKNYSDLIYVSQY